MMFKQRPGASATGSRGTAGGQSLARRMALRDILAHKSTSALVMALVALPLMVLVLVVTLIDSAVPTGEENATRQLGSFEVQLVGNDYPLGAVQNPSDPFQAAGTVEPDSENNSSGVADIPAMLKALDPGVSSTVITSGYLEIQGKAGLMRTDMTVGEISDPRFAGRYILESGDWGDPESVLINQDLAQATDLRVGEQISLGNANYPVSGIMKNSSGMGFRMSGLAQSLGIDGLEAPVLFVAPGHPAAKNLEVSYAAVFAESMKIDLQRQEALNGQGIGSYVRSLIVDPPDSELWSGSTSEQARADALFKFLGIFVIGFFLFLEVGLLSGAAFAVGAKKQRQTFALLSANGAESATIQWIGAYSGLFLGGLAVLLGSALGLAGSWGVTLWSDYRAGGFPGFHVPWVAIAALMLLGLASAVVAALLPARRVARNAALAALHADGNAAPAPKLPVLGFVLLGAGLACWAVALYLGLSATTYGLLNARVTLVVAGFVVGIVLCTAGMMLSIGRILWAIGNAGHRLPLASRLALRDIQRNHGRTVPAIVAVIAGTSLATSLALASGYSLAAAGYQTAPNSSTVYALYLGGSGEDGARLDQSAADKLAGDVLARLERSGYQARSSAQHGQFFAGYSKPAVAQKWWDMQSWAPLLAPGSICRYGKSDVYSNTNPSTAALQERDASLLQSVSDGDRFTARHCGVDGGGLAPWNSYQEVSAQITDLAGLKLMMGKHYSPALGTAFEEGRAIVTVPEFVTDQHWMTFGMPEQSWPADEIDPYYGGNIGVLLGMPLKRSFEIDALESLTGDRSIPPIIMSRNAMIGTGGSVADANLLVDLGRVLDAEEITALNTDLAVLQVHIDAGMERSGLDKLVELAPWLLSLAAAVLVLSTAAVTTGLALADGRRDARVMAGVGAAPHTRRRFGAVQAGLTALLGTVLGIALGALPVVLLITVMEGGIDPAILEPLVVLLVIPPLAALIGWLMVPRTVPADRMGG